MLTLTSAQRDALAARTVVRRVFIWCEAKTPEGAPDPAGFWDDVHDVVYNGRTYHGSGSVVKLGRISAKSDLSIPGLVITLSGLDQSAIDLVRGRLRGQEPIDVRIGLFDPAARTLVGSLIPVFVGFIDNVDVPQPEAGGDSIVNLNCESTSRALTRKGTDTRSDPILKRRNPADDFFKYTGVQYGKPVFFGRASV